MASETCLDVENRKTLTEPISKASESDDASASPRKICGVCGDRALGYNFSAISCESCKAFFRRNALASKEFKCPFEEQCQITVLTRKFCQKCRLEKCLAIGMIKEYIMTAEDKAQKRQKIEQNRAKKRQKEKCRDDEVSSSKVIIIKREENENSGESWSQQGRQFSPSSIDSFNSTNNTQYEILNSTTNSPMSVIINPVVSDNPIEEFSLNVGHYRNDTSDNQFPVHHPAVNNLEHSIGLDNGSQCLQNCFLNESVESNESNVDSLDSSFSLNDKHDSTVIRSMLTPTPSVNIHTTTADVGLPLTQICDDANLTQNNSRDKTDLTKDILQDVERLPIEPNSIESILCEAIKLEFEAYSSIPQSGGSSRELNDAERAKLNELIVANKALLAPLDDDMSNLLADDSRFKPTQSKHDPALLGIINLTAIAIRRLIKMSKKINAFKNMCEEDQVALLKGGCTEMMILRSTMTYDCARDTWKIPHSQEAMSNIKADVLKLAKGNIYQEHDRFIRTFDPRWRLDENIVLIMSAILLFTPDRPRVVHSDVIKLEQNSYYYLLRRYLESTYSGCEAKSTFLKLIQKIMELHKLADEVIGVYLDVNPIEPLLIEIFDLKQH